MQTSLDRITHDPAIMGGKPCIRGMRVTVATIVGLLATGHTSAEVLAAYPYLEPDDISAALAYAAWRSAEVDVPIRRDMKLLIDMNLSPLWAEALQAAGHDAVHWSQIGDARARDPEIMTWAHDHQSVVLTHDLDFTTVLALTHAAGPSVVQIRTQRVLPSAIGPCCSVC